MYEVSRGKAHVTEFVRACPYVLTRWSRDPPEEITVFRSAPSFSSLSTGTQGKQGRMNIFAKMNTSSNLSDPLCMQTHSEEIRLTSRISRHWSHILALFQNIMCCLAVYSLHRRQPYKAIFLWKRNLTSDWFITFYIDRNKQCYLKEVQEFAVSMSLS